MYLISENVCPQDHLCPLVKACPVGAITQNQTGLPVINQQLCIRCGKCYANCPKKAVKEVPDDDAL